MHQKIIKLDANSYIEVATRLSEGEEKVVLALRGVNDSSSPALASVIIDDPELNALIEGLMQVRDRNSESE